MLSNSDSPTAIPELLTCKEAYSDRYRELTGAEWTVVDWGVHC